MDVPFASTRVRLVLAGVLLAACHVGCGATAPPEEVGAVRVAITTVPADVACISLSAAGPTRTVQETFDVMAGASSVLVMSAIPTGMVSFTGRAFPGACASVPMGANPNWLSDPVLAQVTAGTTADVTLLMRKNGNANIRVDFEDDTPPSIATTTELMTSVNPAVTGQRVTLTVTVTANAGMQTPTGSARLREGGTEILTIPLEANGGTAFTISAIAFREHQFSVDYLPTGPFLASASGTVIQAVRPAATHTLLPTPAAFTQIGGQNFVLRGAPVTFNTSVTVDAPGSGAPTGFMTLADQDGAPSLTGQVINGASTFMTSFMTLGTFVFTATYDGEFGFLGSTSPVLSFAVVDQLPGSGMCAVPTGAVSWWHGDGDYVDAVGDNDGAPVGTVTFGGGIHGAGFQLDASQPGFVEVPDAPDLRITNGITIDAWINPTTPSGRIVDKITAFGNDGYLLDLIDNRLRLLVGGFALGTDALQFSGTLTHVAGVYDGQRIALYVNGALVAAAPMGTAPIPTSSHTLRIGADSGGGSQFSGVIDEPRVFNRGLTDVEVQALFEQGTTCQ